MTGPVPPPLASVPTPQGSPEQVRRISAALSRGSVAIGWEADALSRVVAGVTAAWRSVPSSARASGRLSALAALSRSWHDSTVLVAAALSRYAAALDTAQRDAATANASIAAYNLTLVPTPLPPGGSLPPWSRGNGKVSFPPTRADSIALCATAANSRAALRAAEANCLRTVRSALDSSARSALVDVRMTSADAAAGSAAVQWSSVARQGLARYPPDLAAVATAVLALRALATTPAAALLILRELGPLASRLADPPPTPAPGYDPVAVAAAAAGIRAAAAPPVGPVVPAVPVVPAPVADPGSAALLQAEPGRRAVQPVLDFVARALGGADRLGRTSDARLFRDGLALAAAAWIQVGVRLPRSAATLLANGPRRSLNRLQAGDLVFWRATPSASAPITRLGVYVGTDQVAVVDADKHVRLIALDRHDPHLDRNAVRPVVEEAATRIRGAAV